MFDICVPVLGPNVSGTVPNNTDASNNLTATLTDTSLGLYTPTFVRDAPFINPGNTVTALADVDASPCTDAATGNVTVSACRQAARLARKRASQTRRVETMVFIGRGECLSVYVARVDHPVVPGSAFRRRRALELRLNLDNAGHVT